MAWIKRKAPKGVPERKVPQVKVDAEAVPHFAETKRLSNVDLAILKRVSTELSELGVLDKEADESAYEVIENQEDMIFDAAQQGERNVSMLSSKSELAHRFLSEREAEEGDTFVNPAFDGIDDYGNEMYDDLYGDDMPDLDESYSPSLSFEETIKSSSYIDFSDKEK